MSHQALRQGVSGIACCLVVGGALLAGAPPLDAAQNGTAEYEYKVTAFDYTAIGDVVGDRHEGSCTPVLDSSWIGHAVTEPPELAPLDFGNASLRIGPHGTSGSIDAKIVAHTEFGPAEYTEVTECNGDGAHPGQATDFATTDCTDRADTNLVLSATIDGKVGPRVKIDWVPQEIDDHSGWLPDSFTCGQRGFVFPSDQCKSSAKLEQFTAKRVKLPFSCRASTYTPPAGQVTTDYLGQAIVSGSVVLKRTKRG